MSRIKGLFGLGERAVEEASTLARQANRTEPALEQAGKTAVHSNKPKVTLEQAQQAKQERLAAEALASQRNAGKSLAIDNLDALNPGLYRREELSARLEKLGTSAKEHGLIDDTIVRAKGKILNAKDAEAALRKGEPITPAELSSLKASKQNDFEKWAAKDTKNNKGAPTAASGGNSHNTVSPDPAPKPTSGATPVVAAPTTIGGAIMQTGASIFNSMGSNTKKWVVGLSLAYASLVDVPFTEGTDPLIKTAYQNVVKALNGTWKAEAHKEIATVKQAEQVNTNQQRATSSLINNGGALLSGDNNATPEKLVSFFTEAVKRDAPEIDEKKLEGYSQKFAGVAAKLDVDGNGTITNRERIGLANSKDFIELMKEITELSPKAKTTLLNQLIPAGPGMAP